ncbi:MAG: sulfatase [Candidatus Theseobacter exili]|nr:sulfatase [Candidatus Theseobacter exili]
MKIIIEMTLKISLLLILVLPLNLFAKQKSRSVENPNIVFILADDCTNWDIGCYGSKDSKTPNIDRLAEEGMKFQRCYQAAPMCAPTRQNIYTGLHPVKSGAYRNHSYVYPDTKSIVSYLKPLGYRVALSGKRHIGPDKVFSFEYISGANSDFDGVDKFLNEVKTTGEPFALMLCFDEPHTPWNKGDASQFDPDEITLPPHFFDNEQTRKIFCDYLAEINYLDGQVGTAMELLDKYELNKNTLVIFASEQGAQLPFAKWTCYEAGVKSALIARMPEMIEPGTVSDAIVEYVDMLPTFIDIADGKKIKDLDGKSLLPILKGEGQKVKDYSFSIQTTKGINAGSPYYGIRAIVNDRYRYIWNLTPDAEFKCVLNNAKKIWLNEWYLSWKKEAEHNVLAKSLVDKYRFRPGEELYDIIEDKWCQKNLADHPEFYEIKKKLRKELLKWMKECGDKGQQTELEAATNKPKHNIK